MKVYYPLVEWGWIRGHTGSMDFILNLVKIMKNTIELGWIWKRLWFQRVFSTPSLQPGPVCGPCFRILYFASLFCFGYKRIKTAKPLHERNWPEEGDMFIWFCYTPNLKLASASFNRSSFCFSLPFFLFYFSNVKISPIPNPLSHFLFCGVM